MSGLAGKRVRAAAPGLGEETGAVPGGSRPSARPRTELGPVPRPYRGTALLRGRRLSVAGRPSAPRGVLRSVVARADWAPEGGPVYASSAAIQRSTQNWHGPGESDCLIKTKHCDRPPTGVDAM